MKVSMFLAGAGFASQAYAGAALFIRTTVGGSASSNFNLWTWDGGLADDWKNKGVDSDRTCDLGGANDASCENNGYKGHLVNSNTNGCNNHEDVNEGYITTPSGEEVNVVSDSRCQAIEVCSSGTFGGSNDNGYQCDI